MKDLLKEYRYHLGRMIDLAERIGASKEEICNDVIILSAGRLIGFKERRYPAIRQGGGATSPWPSSENRLRSQVTAFWLLVLSVGHRCDALVNGESERNGIGLVNRITN